MEVSGQELRKEAQDAKDGIRKVVNAAALKKREERKAREAKQRKTIGGRK